MGGRVAIALCWLALAGGRARAESSGAVATPQPGPAEAGLAALAHDPALLPSPSLERARLSAALAVELSLSLQHLAGVADARVHLLAPVSAPSLLGAPAPAAKASVLLVLEANAPSVDHQAAVRALVAGAVPELAPEAVSVVQTRKPAGPSARTAPGPERGSDPTLRWILLALLCSQLLGAAGTLVLLRRLRSVEMLTKR
jgi:type III secretory pathway lipoprotein EscJ